MNNEQLFDSIIKDKLQNIFIEQPDNAWTKFSNASKMKTAREGHFFDQAINKSLINVDTTVTGNEWLAFKNHWDQYAHNIENEFDDQIRSSIRKEKITMDARAFEILESAIASSSIKNRNLIPSKIIEAFLMAVILLLLFMYTPLLQQSTTEEPQPINKEIENNDQQKFDRADNNTAVEDVVYGNSKTSETNKYTATSSSNSAKVSNKGVNSKSVENQNFNSNYSTSVGSSVTSFSSVSSVSPFDQNNSGNLITFEKTHSGSVLNQNISPSMQIENSHYKDFSSSDHNDFKEFNKLNPNSITPSSLYSNELFPNYVMIPFKMVNNKKLLSAVWLGVKLGRAFDVIKTPVTSSEGKLVSTQRIKSSIIDFNLEIKNDFVNIETGVKYSYKKFGAGQDKGEKAHFINIPLSLKKEFFPDNKIVPFIKLGPDVTLVAAAVYKPNNDASSLNSRGNQLAPYSGYTDQEIEDGLFKSGKLSSNSFLGIHGAIGFDVKINNMSKFNFEINQQINPFEKGLGINNHRFSETSISLGYKRLLFENLY